MQKQRGLNVKCERPTLVIVITRARAKKQILKPQMKSKNNTYQL